MLSYNEALEIIKTATDELKKEIIEVNLLDSLNYVLSENIYADTNQPLFDNSAVDGYAVKFDPNIREWELIGELPAGNYREYLLTNSTTVNIMTGGKIPENCTTVIPLEDVDVTGGRVKLKEGIEIRDGMNIRHLGENIHKGELAVSKNTLISAHKISVLAACGKAKVKVFKWLKVGVFSTGDELIDISETPTEDKIRATNIYSLIAMLKHFNFEPVNLGFTDDNRDKIKEKVKEALESDIDILLTTGGVSVGKYDYLKEIFEELGVGEKFWRAYIKPGKPIYFGIYRKQGKTKLVFGLAGNPVSSFVNFYVYFLPAIEKLYSIKFDNKFRAKLKDTLKKKDGKRHFIRGIFEFDNTGKFFVVQRAGSQSSGNMVGLSNANCLIIFEEEKRVLGKGDFVECIRI